MKNLLIITTAIILAISCRKTSEIDDFSDSLEVQEKNMSLITKFTGTGCAPCGSSGYTKFESFKEEYKGKATFLAFRSGVSMPNYYQAKSALTDEFGLRTSTPSFSYNYIQDDSKEIMKHVNSDVIVNSNYNLSISGDILNLETTTKFFQTVNGEYLILPYVVVNGIVGYQKNHPDSPNTKLDKNVAGVANPKTFSTKQYLGYTIGNGKIAKGYTINLDFEYRINSSWDKDKIEVVLVILKKENNKYVFVNSFSK